MNAIRHISATLLLITPLSVWAADQAVLRNGFVIRHEKREVTGSTTRLYLSTENANFVDIATEEIAKIESAPEEPAQPTSDPQKSLIPAAFKPAPDLAAMVSRASNEHLLDPDLIRSVIKAESAANPKAVSRKGAMGMMQLMPATARKLGVLDSFDAEANINGGTKYLRELLELYNYDLVKALAAYNAGPQRVEQYKGVPPYRETRAYVARVVHDFNRTKSQSRRKQSLSASAKLKNE